VHKDQNSVGTVSQTDSGYMDGEEKKQSEELGC